MAVISQDIETSIAAFREVFLNDGTLNIRRFTNSTDENCRFCVIFLDGMVNTQLINDNIIRSLMLTDKLNFSSNLLSDVLERGITGNTAQKTSDINTAVQALLSGDSVVLIDGFYEVLYVNTRGYAIRSISEPDDEKSLRGPREGFCENLMTNLSMIRRKIQSPALKFNFDTIGKNSKTKYCICYIEGIADNAVIDELTKRVKALDITRALDVQNIEERIRDSRFSIFKTIGSTEKPDVAAARLLEGRVLLILDGTPIVMTVPYLFIENFQSPDDYYLNFYFAGVGRIIRMIAFWASVSIPAIYVALVAFHTEMIPDSLLRNIAASSKGVPLTTALECAVMLFIFELLRETGIRMPDKIGGALSIVGALVVGQAAVEAKFISAPMVIVVAITGISGLMIPRLKGSVIMLRFLFLFAASILGLYGYYLSLIALITTLCSLRSFGKDMVANYGMRDTLVRTPFGGIKR